jgi:alkaline phosphatase D
MKFRNNQRGYVRTRITADELRADFRVVDWVSIPNAPVHTRASFVVADREARINPPRVREGSAMRSSIRC